jgi:hypothetical protein
MGTANARREASSFTSADTGFSPVFGLCLPQSRTGNCRLPGLPPVV